MTTPDLRTPTEVAEYLRVPLSTLQSWHRRGHGPPALRVGKHLRYRTAHVEAWLAEQVSA